MLSKKWKKLSINKNEIDSLKEEEKNDEEQNKEIIIINMGNNSDVEEEEEDINNVSKENISKINLKYSRLKQKPIINVDPNSIGITNYIIENKPKSTYYHEKTSDIKDIMIKYSPKYINSYNSEKNNQQKTYNLNKNVTIDEIKNKYQINDINSRNKILNHSKPFEYTSNTYRRNFSNNLNNIYTDNYNNSFNLNNSKKENIYHNYGPIYNFERNKELKNQIISDINEYKISNPYKKTYYMTQKDNSIEPTKILDETSIINKSDIKKDYPNLFFYNNYKNNITPNINKYSTIQEKINNSRNNPNPVNKRKIYSVERTNRMKKNFDIRKATFNLDKKLGYLNSSINTNDTYNDNTNKNQRRNNSMINLKNDNRIINEYNHNYSNKYLLNNYIKNSNKPKNYEIRDIDNLFQYYPSYNKANNFSGHSSYANLNYIYH